MGYDPPGLEQRPDEKDLIGFRSLMPQEEKKPGLVSRILKLPFKLLALPVKALAAVLRFPAKLFRRSGGGDSDG